MALLAKLVTFTTPTSTGSLAVTGAGFAPKWCMLFGNKLTADGNAADASRALGAGTSSSNRVTVAGHALDNVTTRVAHTSQDNAHIYNLMANSATVLVQADLTSLDADGATFNFTTVDAGNAYVVCCLFLGGADLANSYQSADTNPTTTGNKAITGFGFQPKIVMVYAASGTSTANPSTATNSWRHAFGAAISTSARWGTGGCSFNTTSSTAGSHQLTTKLYLNNSATSDAEETDLVSLDAGGFTQNWSSVAASNRFFYFTGLAGPLQVAVGTFNQKTSTGTQATTGVGFKPVVVILSSYAATSGAGFPATNENSFGVATATTERAVCWFGEGVTGSTSVCSQRLDRTKVVSFYTPAGASPTVLADADLQSFDPDGWTLNWVHADGTARAIGYVALGHAALAVPGPQPIMVGQAINRSVTR